MIINDKLYDILKLLSQIILPLVATFYITLAELWNLPYPKEISGTITAIDTLLGSLLIKLSSNYQKNNFNKSPV